jgi:hypothetical protein
MATEPQPEVEVLDANPTAVDFPPLDPNLDYLDATAALQAMAKNLRAARAKSVQLEKALMMQSQINGRLLENMNSLLLRVAQLENANQDSANGSRIIMPPRLSN